MDAEKTQEFDNNDQTPWADVVRFYRENFNTVLSPDEEWKFHVSMDECESSDALDDYDLRGAWKDGGIESDNRPDKYAKPNYLTFTDGSIYHGTPDIHHGGEYVGGVWGTQDDHRSFRPSKEMLCSTHPLIWFKAEMKAKHPDVILILDEDTHE